MGNPLSLSLVLLFLSFADFGRGGVPTIKGQKGSRGCAGGEAQFNLPSTAHRGEETKEGEEGGLVGSASPLIGGGGGGGKREVPRWGSGLEGILLGEWRLRFDKTMVIYCFCTCGECHSQKVEKLLPKYGYEGNLDPLFPFCSAEID